MLKKRAKELRKTIEKTASIWSTYASQIRALEDYTVDGTVTGELDPSKIQEE